jgi:hypothetical protein
MRAIGWKRIAVYIAGTVVLGALGSGLWEIALKPGGRWVGRALLTVATLGSGYLKDQVYIEAAKGYHESSANQSFSLINLILFWLCSAVIVFGFQLANKTVREVKRLCVEEGAEAGSTEKLDALIDDIFRKIKQVRVMLWTLVFVCLLLIGDETAHQLEAAAADDAYTYFSQSLTICRPFIDPHQAQMLESRFTSIRGRADYVSVADELKRIASANGLRLPPFNPW